MLAHIFNGALPRSVYAPLLLPEIASVYEDAGCKPCARGLWYCVIRRTRDPGAVLTMFGRCGAGMRAYRIVL